MSATESTLWDKFKNVIGGSVIKTITEIHSLMPDSILFGSLLLYFLTQNISFGVFSIFIFETVLSHRFISWMFSQSVGLSRSSDVKCRVGFKTPQFNVQRMFSHDQYPSYAIFSISSIATYLGLATNEFSKTMEEMGSEWSGRSMIAYIFIGLVLAIFIIARLITCDNIGEIVVALFLAVMVGGIFFYINKVVFGVESMNFLGLPYMVSKDEKGSPIYVCSAEKST
jgi:hypothetical protein